MDWIPYGRQDICEEDIAVVESILRSDFLTQGPAVPSFEAAVAGRVGASRAVAFSSGTAGLHGALKAMGVGHGDLVWTSPITFVASANAARYCGAKVDFVDVDGETVTLCPLALERKLEKARAEGQLPKVVIPVHFGGQSCDMKAISALAHEFGFRVLEDAAHALGGEYDGQPVGDCRFSDATMFSFHPVKIVTSGEGGVVTTNDPELADFMLEFRSHGITRDAERMVNVDEGPWYYEQRHLGYHYRMTDIQAALGESQMKRLDEFVARRRDLAAVYDERFQTLSDVVVPLGRSSDALSAWHLYVVRLKLDGLKTDRRTVFEAMREAGIGVNVHYIPVHHQPSFERFGFKRGDFPVAESYYENCITLPMFPGLSESDVSRVVETLEASIKRAE